MSSSLTPLYIPPWIYVHPIKLKTAMAESRPPNERIGTPSSSPDATTFGQDVLDSIQALSQPVEMSDLSESKAADQLNSNSGDSKDGDERDSQRLKTAKTEASNTQNESVQAMTTIESTSQPDSAIGPATDRPTRIRSSSGSGPQLNIILLLHSTQTRHPYIINEKYLKKRNISVVDNDPTNMSVYTLKELIWRDWREGKGLPVGLKLKHN